MSIDRMSQADRIIALMEDSGVEFVHDSAQVGYALVPLANRVCAAYAIRSSTFRTLVAKRFYEACGKAPRAAAMTDAKAVLEGQAIHDGRLVDVALRVARDEDGISVDLGDDDWSKVHISARGWTIKPHGRTLFRRTPGMLALPHPVSGGTLNDLRDFVRTDDEGFALECAFLLNALQPQGPFPILMLGGEQGSAKTTTARILRALIDPNRAPVRAECRDERDLAISANNAHLLAFDNLSHLTPQMSDALCRLATGGGFTTRMLYTDQDEVIFDAKRPVIITSIVDVASRPDLLDRALVVRHVPIPEQERKEERTLWSEFLDARPRLLGGLLDAVSSALRNLCESRLSIRKPRMADAYVFALGGVSSPEVLQRAWSRTADDAMATTLEGSLVSTPLCSLVGEDAWSGTATELLIELAKLVTESTVRRREWPKTARSLAGEVRRIAPALRAAGIDHCEDRQPQTGARLHIFARTPIKACVTTVTQVTGAVTISDRGDHGLPQVRHCQRASVTTNTQEKAFFQWRDDGDDGKAASFSEGEAGRLARHVPRITDDGVVRTWE